MISIPQAAYMIVDEMHEEHPELLKDQYWEEVVPSELPYTLASGHYRRSEPKGSAENYVVKEADSLYANVIPTSRKANAEEYADYVSLTNIHQQSSTRHNRSYYATQDAVLRNQKRNSVINASMKCRKNTFTLRRFT